MSHIHFKSVYNINYDKVTFDSTSLTLRELKNLIAEKSKLSKKLDFDLEISNAQTSQVYQENDVILKNSRVIVKRVIKNSTTPLRQKSPKPSSSLLTSQSGLNLPNLASDRLSAKSKSVSPSPSSTNLKESANVSSDKTVYDSLAPLSIAAKPLVYIEGLDKQTPEGDVRMDEKAKLESILASSMTKSPISETRMQGFAKSWQKQASPINRPIPPGYVCVICRKPGHLKQFCPDAANLPKPEERPKYPSGIPRTNLRPAQPGEKFAMLGPEGYVVTEIDKEAAKVVKKDRFLFEDEEINSEKIEIETKIEEIPKELKCPFGDHLLKDAVLVPCCGHFICCDECIRQKIISEETIICPNKECDQEIGPMVSITPDHETRKKVQDYLSKLKRKKPATQTEAKTDVFFDMIMSEVNGKEEDLEKSEPISPLQDSNISSSELLSQQLIAASAEYQQMSPVPLPSPPITPTVDLSQVRAQSHAYSSHQYRARFLGQKTYSGQPFPHGTQGFYPHMPRGSFYGQLRPRFMRPAVNMYPQMPFYPTIEPNYQNRRNMKVGLRKKKKSIGDREAGNDLSVRAPGVDPGIEAIINRDTEAKVDLERGTEVVRDREGSTGGLDRNRVNENIKKNREVDLAQGKGSTVDLK
ncbi:E3 ubiquitin- ligase RBBP6 isoform X1, partial [Brachionus plicatilis]